jgi:hypothetical protein
MYSHEAKIFRDQFVFRGFMHDHSIETVLCTKLPVRCFRITEHGYGALGVELGICFMHTRNTISRACSATQRIIEQITRTIICAYQKSCVVIRALKRFGRWRFYCSSCVYMVFGNACVLRITIRTVDIAASTICRCLCRLHHVL